MVTVTARIGAPWAAASLRVKSIVQVPEKSGERCAVKPTDPRATTHTVERKNFMLCSLQPRDQRSHNQTAATTASATATVSQKYRRRRCSKQ